MSVWWQRLLDALRGEYDRRIRAASQVTSYRPPDPISADTRPAEAPVPAQPALAAGAVAVVAHTHDDDGDDDGDDAVVIANVPPGKQV